MNNLSTCQPDAQSALMHDTRSLAAELIKLYRMILVMTAVSAEVRSKVSLPVQFG